MHEAVGNKKLTQAGFMHIPYIDSQVLNKSAEVASMSLQAIITAIEITLKTCLVTKVDILQSGGAIS